MGFPGDLKTIKSALAKDTAFAEFDPKDLDPPLRNLADPALDHDAFLLDAMALFARAGNGHSHVIPNAAVRIVPQRMIWAGYCIWAVGPGAGAIRRPDA